MLGTHKGIKFLKCLKFQGDETSGLQRGKVWNSTATLTWVQTVKTVKKLYFQACRVMKKDWDSAGLSPELFFSHRFSRLLSKVSCSALPEHSFFPIHPPAGLIARSASSEAPGNSISSPLQLSPKRWYCASHRLEVLFGFGTTTAS